MKGTEGMFMPSAHERLCFLGLALDNSIVVVMTVCSAAKV